MSFVKNKDIIRLSKESSYDIFFADNDGKLMFDDMIRLEYFDEDTQRIFERIGIKRPKIEVRNVNREQKSHREYYGKEAAEIVQNIYASDIEVFGYSF